MNTITTTTTIRSVTLLLLSVSFVSAATKHAASYDETTGSVSKATKRTLSRSHSLPIKFDDTKSELTKVTTAESGKEIKKEVIAEGNKVEGSDSKKIMSRLNTLETESSAGGDNPWETELCEETEETTQMLKALADTKNDGFVKGQFIVGAENNKMRHFKILWSDGDYIGIKAMTRKKFKDVKCEIRDIKILEIGNFARWNDGNADWYAMVSEVDGQKYIVNRSRATGTNEYVCEEITRVDELPKDFPEGKEWNCYYQHESSAGFSDAKYRVVKKTSDFIQERGYQNEREAIKYCAMINRPGRKQRKRRYRSY